MHEQLRLLLGVWFLQHKVTMWRQLAFIFLSLVLSLGHLWAGTERGHDDPRWRGGRQICPQHWCWCWSTDVDSNTPAVTQAGFSERSIIFFSCAATHFASTFKTLADPLGHCSKHKQPLKPPHCCVCGRYHPAPTNFFNCPALLNFPDVFSGEPTYVDFTQNQWCEGCASSFWCIIPTELVLIERRKRMDGFI